MRVDLEDAGGFFAPPRILVVDDFVTKGATLYAAAALVAQALPSSDVHAFALVRTMGLVPEIEDLVGPVEKRLSSIR